MRRLVLILAVTVIATAAPLRAWCEATCLAPAESSASHCPTHEPAGDTISITAASGAKCPALDSARTSIPARLDVTAALVPLAVAPLPTPAPLARAEVHRRTATTVFERCTPLRI